VRLRRADGPPLCIGHRGTAALAPANSAAAIEAALAAGVDLVEIDVLAVRGGGILLTHSARELSSEPLALDDALGLVAAHQAGVLLDVKGAGFERELVAAVRRHGLLERALVSTTRLGVLRRIAALEPELQRSVTYPRNRSRAAVLARVPGALPGRVAGLVVRAGAAAATLNHRIVTPAVVERCHGPGIAVLVWTVNDAPLFRRLDDLGVDGVITDDPAICRATLQA
jgi:glycerophosphoryl diester phosphodiesterase